MTNRYFDEPRAPAEHPRLRAWSAYLRAANVVRAEVDVRRAREAFGFGEATLYVDFVNASGVPERQESAAWEEDLDVWLVAQGVRARSPEVETLRTMLRLRDRLYRLLFKYGDGYFNALVVHVVKNGPLADDESVRKVLANLHANKPYDGGTLAQRVEEADAVLTRTAHELTGKLKYERPDAERILADAVAMYLDERFHVTERLRIFGR